MAGGIELTWAGGAHVFELKIEHLRALQQKCDAGPEWIMNRVRSAHWRVDDVINTIRFGLEGGGMPANEARKLVEDYLEDKPRNLKATTLVAAAIIGDALYDLGCDVVGEPPLVTGSPPATS